MNWNKIILYLTLLSFLLMGSTGLLLFYGFSDDVFNKIWGFNKSKWLDFHMIMAVITILLTSYHVIKRWPWIDKYIFRNGKSNPNKEIISRRRNNTWMMIMFSLTASSGFLAWIASGDCPLCLEFHPYSGITLWLVFLFHLYKHRRFFQ